MRKNFSFASAQNLIVGLTHQNKETISCFKSFNYKNISKLIFKTIIESLFFKDYFSFYSVQSSCCFFLPD